MAYLFVLNGTARCRAFPLEGDEVRIGKSPGCEIRLEDPWISWQHARIVRDGGGWRLEDLDSTNGTWRNGEPVREAVLEDEDVLFFGRTHAFVVLSDRPPSAPLPARGARAGAARSVSDAELERWLSDEESVRVPGGSGAAATVGAAGGAEGEQDAAAARVGAHTMQIAALPLLDGDELEQLEAEDEAQVDRDAFAAPAPQDADADGWDLLAAASFGASTDSLFAQPALQGQEAGEDGGIEIDVGDLLAPEQLGDGTEFTTLEPVIAPPPATESEEIARLREQLAAREEQIRRLQAELLRLKERYIDE